MLRGLQTRFGLQQAQNLRRRIRGLGRRAEVGVGKLESLEW